MRIEIHCVIPLWGKLCLNFNVTKFKTVSIFSFWINDDAIVYLSHPCPVPALTSLVPAVLYGNEMVAIYDVPAQIHVATLNKPFFPCL